MDTDFLLIVGLLIVVPGILFPLAFWYYKSEGFNNRFPDALYQLSFLGKTFVISKHLAFKVITILAMYSWMDSLFPLPMTLAAIFGALLWLRIAKAKPVEATDLSSASESLVTRLNAMQTEISDIKQHMESLGVHIITKQIELDEKEEIKRKLESEIEEKSNEAEFWTSLTDDERNLVLDTAVNTVKQGTKGQFVLGIILGFFINLFAAFTWSLMGSPGKEQIILKLTKILDFFQTIPNN